MARKRDRKIYSVYRITSPSGRQYVGYTSMDLMDRWYRHKSHAKEPGADQHPLYQEIRAYEGQGFTIDLLYVTDNRITALGQEERFIASTQGALSLNLSPGGNNDASEGGKVFWERINAEPQKREAYLKKLSDVKKANDWSDYDDMSRKRDEWRRAHPREAYKKAYRAIRIANKAAGRRAPSEPKEDPMPLKERLLRKYKPGVVKSKRMVETWAGRTEEEREAINGKISQSKKQYMQTLTDEERKASTEAARKAIDVSVQGPAASSGLKNFWRELRADPERYAEYMRRRSATFKATMQKRKEAVQ